MSGLRAVCATITALACVAVMPPVAGVASGAETAAATTLRVLPLGDSITWGVGSSTGNSYRSALWNQLRAEGHPVDMAGSGRNGDMADPDNEGHSGWRIDQIAGIADTTLARYRPNVVTLEIGTNDLGQQYQVPTAPDRLHALIDQITRDAPDATVLVGSLIVSTSSTEEPLRGPFNAAIPGIVQAEQAAGRHVRYVDMSALTAADLADALHPNDNGYRKMAEAFNAGIQAADSAGWLKPPGTVGRSVRSGVTGKCLDVNGGSSANGTVAQIWGCNGTNAQLWSSFADNSLQALGKCLDVTGAGTANGSPVAIWDCHGGTNQQWQPYNGGFRNPASGRCLDDPASSAVDGTQLVLWDCNGGANQKWTADAAVLAAAKTSTTPATTASTANVAAAVICNKYCEPRDPSLSTQDRIPVTATLSSRTLALHFDDADAMGWASIENGAAGDEVWLDRSMDGGKTWGSGSKLGDTRTPAGGRNWRTQMYNVDDWNAQGVGALRACGQPTGGTAIACTAWARTTWNAGDRRTAAATALMMSYDRGTKLFGGSGWWTSANALTAVIDNARVTGMSSYRYTIADTYTKNLGAQGGNFTNEYLDDTGWWGLAWVDAYDMTGDSRYLNTARADADHMFANWNTTCGGGVRWSTNGNYKNAITNELFLQLTSALHNRIPGDTTYLTRAKNEWTWFKNSGMINGDHLINDGLSDSCVKAADRRSAARARRR